MLKEEVLKNYINGEWIEPKTARYEEVYNPATEEVIACVPLSTREETRQAIAVAHKAFETWSKTDVFKRARILFDYHQLLQEHRQELAELITQENGKTLQDALGEVQRGIENVEFAAGAPTLMMGDSLASIATGVEGSSFRYPIGVIGGITPFNFPMMVPCWMFPMAIALGNTFVLKPSEKTPLLAERLVLYLEEAGLPKGVLNLVQGGHDVVNELLENPLVQGVSFVGSKAVGKYVYQKGSEFLKRVQALTGAKNHVIVLRDADLDLAVKSIVSAAFGSAGERCMAASVILVEKEVSQRFLERLKRETEQIKVGNGMEEGVLLGPVIRKEALERTKNYVQAGIEEGAQLLVDGRKPKLGKGFFIGPSIFTDVDTSMTIWKEEIFAPVLCVMEVDNLEEAVSVTNQSEYANGACLFTDSASAIRYFRENIDAGMLGINLGVPAPMAVFPFSGWKSSFYGTLHANGKDSVDFYTRKKIVTAKLGR